MRCDEVPFILLIPIARWTVALGPPEFLSFSYWETFAPVQSCRLVGHHSHFDCHVFYDQWHVRSNTSHHDTSYGISLQVHLCRQSPRPDGHDSHAIVQCNNAGRCRHIGKGRGTKSGNNWQASHALVTGSRAHGLNGSRRRFGQDNRDRTKRSTAQGVRAKAGLLSRLWNYITSSCCVGRSGQPEDHPICLLSLG